MLHRKSTSAKRQAEEADRPESMQSAKIKPYRQIVLIKTRKCPRK